MSDLPASAQKVSDTAASMGLAIAIKEFPDGTRTAVDAAEAVGCVVNQIVKSMIFNADGELILALTSGGNLVDGDALAILADVRKCGRADADAVRVHTGYAIGGVPPFGHDHAVRTWIDPVLLDFDQVWAAAGTPHHVFPIEPNDLVRITGAVVASFTQ
ncbi:MAG: prolyl-tRNA editing enzyme YbaK/EbsC (Cys-tRNA(Pro) deacylase) [Acidimicrobiales bacterium]|jgi:prolyl-tRNA editing enzyme YbaK/EbsC (Cys-tRNA(Pro) deacylase)